MKLMISIPTTVALTLEHLEAAFYKEGLAKLSADDFKSADFPEWVRYRLTEISSHESQHVTFLTGALEAAGAKAAAACTYNFGISDPASFIAIAQQLEGVGVSAYAGAAALITSPVYLTYAADVLSVEVSLERHRRTSHFGRSPPRRSPGVQS